MGYSHKKLRATRKTTSKTVRKRRRSSDKDQRSVESRKRLPPRLSAMCAIRFLDKQLRKTIRALCKEYKFAENPDQELIRALEPVLVKSLCDKTARLTYIRVYTPNVRYHAEVGDDGVRPISEVQR